MKRTGIFIACELIFIAAFLAVGCTSQSHRPETFYDSCGNEIPRAITGENRDIKARTPLHNPMFRVDGDCVADDSTGLMWARNGNLPNEGMTWYDAVSFCNTLWLCGYSDWRLPDINELGPKVNRLKVPNGAECLNTQGFYNVQSGYYWSSTTKTSLIFGSMPVDGVWTRSMINGNIDYIEKSGKYYVWPVRGGNKAMKPGSPGSQ